MTALGDPVGIRPRRPDDLAACVAILARTHVTEGYPVRAAAVDVSFFTRVAGVAWVAVDADRVVGHVAVVPHAEPGVLEVARLFTDPDVRGRGVGGALMGVALDHARGADRVVLEVVDGSAAVGFYERSGWQPTGAHPASWTTPDGTRPLLRTFERPSSP